MNGTKVHLSYQIQNPLAEANGNMMKKKTEMKIVMDNIYCRRFQPTEQRNRLL